MLIFLNYLKFFLLKTKFTFLSIVWFRQPNLQCKEALLGFIWGKKAETPIKILALPLWSTDVPLGLRPLPGLTSQTCLPSTQTTSEVTASLRPPSPEWKTNLGSTSPNSSPLAWLPYITQSRPPSHLRPRRWLQLHVTSRCHPFLSSPEPDT